MALSKNELDAIVSRIISPDQYRDLDKEDKELYMPYNPSAGNAALEQLMRVISSNMMLPILMQPVYEILSRLPDPNPIEKLANLMRPLEQMLKTLDAIKSLEDVPVVGQLAKPVVDLINSLLEVFGGFISLFFLIGRGVPLFWDNAKRSKDILKKYMDENEENTESIMTAYSEVDWKDLAANNPVMYQFIKTIRPQIIEPLDTITKTVDTLITTIEAIEESGATYDDQLKNWERIFKFLGIKTDSLKIPTDEEVASKLSNPLNVVKSWNETLENICGSRYILKSDNEKLMKIRLEQEAKKKAEEEAKKKNEQEKKNG